MEAFLQQFTTPYGQFVIGVAIAVMAFYTTFLRPHP